MPELDRRTLFRAGAAGTGGLVLGSFGGEAVARPQKGRVLAQGMVVPWGIAFLPNGNALVGERRTGDVFRVSRTGGKTRIGHVPKVADNGEGGLLGLALHPGFTSNHWVYAYITTASDNRIVRMRYDGRGFGPQRLVLGGIPVADNGRHSGGRLVFGPDGLLYASTGDADGKQRAQNTGSKAGKILRLTPSGEVPAGNPFDNYAWSYGHRNVEGLAFDGKGQLWATEFGDQARDELNKIARGHNYGWPDVEGGDGQGGFHDPFVTWRPTSTCSPSGLAIAGGRAWVGALRGQCLFSVRLTGPDARRKKRWFGGDFGRIRTVQKAPDGSLWITSSNRDGRGTPRAHDDKVIRIRP
ncbi:MAG: PQQ-dependent sugar dehydrogenase [Nocardioides sp.]